MERLKKKSKEILLLGFLISAVFLLQACKEGHTEQVKRTFVPEVGTITVKTQSVELTKELPGRTSAYLVSEVRPQVNGIIKKRFFTEGSDVKEGDLLYLIDPAPFEVAYDSAKAALKKAEASLPSIESRARRYKALVQNKAITVQEYDDAAAAVDQVKAEIEYCKTQVESAKINLSYTKVKAPISGRIGKSNITNGALVTAYQPVAMAKIQTLDPIYVDVVQSSSELLELKNNLKNGEIKNSGDQAQEVTIILEDGSKYTQKGVLKFRDVSVDPSTGSYTLRIVVPNKDNTLLPGMFVRAVVSEGIAENAILVPQQGVTRNHKGEPVAFVVNDKNTVEQRKLKLYRAIGNEWMVMEGLNAGDKLVIEGSMNISSGSVVSQVSLDSESKQNKLI